MGWEDDQIVGSSTATMPAPPVRSRGRREPLPTVGPPVDTQPETPPSTAAPAPQQKDRGFRVTDWVPAEPQAPAAPVEPEYRKYTFEGKTYSFHPNHSPESIKRYFSKLTADRRKLTPLEAGGRSQAIDSKDHEFLRSQTELSGTGLTEYAQMFSSVDKDGRPITVAPDDITPATLSEVVKMRKKAAAEYAKDNRVNPVSLREFNEDTTAMERDLNRIFANETTLEYKRRMALARGTDPGLEKATESAISRDEHVKKFWRNGRREEFKPEKPLGWFESMTPRRLLDAGVVALKGAVGLPQAITGLADLAPVTTGVTAPLGPVGAGAVNTALSQAGVPLYGWSGWMQQKLGIDYKAAQETLYKAYSPEQQRAFEQVSGADGVIGKIQAALNNPSTILMTVAESAPQMLAGGVAGKAIGASGMLGNYAKYAGAVGEGLMSAGQQAEQARSESSNGLLTDKQAALAAASGALTGVISAVGGKVASKLGIEDIDMMLAGTRPDKEVQNRLIAAVAAAITEGTEEAAQSAQEQIAVNLAAGKPWTDGLDEAAVMGALSGTAMGAGTQMVPASARQRVEALREKLDAGGTVSRADAKAWKKVTGQDLPTDQQARTEFVRNKINEARGIYGAELVPEGPSGTATSGSTGEPTPPPVQTGRVPPPPRTAVSGPPAASAPSPPPITKRPLPTPATPPSPVTPQPEGPAGTSSVTTTVDTPTTPAPEPAKTATPQPSQPKVETPATIPATPVLRKAKPGDYRGFKSTDWLKNSLDRAPSEVVKDKDPRKVADWIRKGFDDGYYLDHLRQTGKTLEQALADMMGVELPAETSIVTQPTTPEVSNARPIRRSETEVSQVEGGADLRGTRQDQVRTEPAGEVAAKGPQAEVQAVKPPARKTPATPPPIKSPVDRLLSDATDDELTAFAKDNGIEATDRAGIVKAIHDDPELSKFAAENLPEEGKRTVPVKQDNSPLGKKVRATLDAVNKATKGDIVQVERPADPMALEAENFAQRVAKKVGGKKVPVVWYAGQQKKTGHRGFAKDGVVYMNADAEGKDIFWNAVSHEVSHATGIDRTIDLSEDALKQSSDEYLADFRAQFGDEATAELESKPDLLKSEATAHFIGKLFQDPAFRAQLQKENPSLWKRIVEAVRKVFEKAGLMASENPDIAKVRDAFFGTMGEGTTASSTTSTVSGIDTEGGPIQFTVKSYLEGTWTDQFRKTAKDRGWLPHVIDSSLGVVQSIVDIFQAHSDVLPQEGTIHPTSGKLIPALVSNADFKYTLDPTRLCKRVMQYWATVKIIEKNIDRVMTEDELLALGQEMRADGDIPGCIFCYVEASRRAARRNASAFTEPKEKIFETDRLKGGKPRDALRAALPARDKLLKQLGWSLDDLASFVVNEQAVIETLNKGRAAIDEARNAKLKEIKDRVYRKEKIGTANNKSWQSRTKDPKVRDAQNAARKAADEKIKKEFSAAVSKVDAQALKKAGPKTQLIRLYNEYVLSAKGTAMTPLGTYMGEILTKEDILESNERAGLRWLSATDLDPTQLVDTMQAMLDATVMGVMGHEYTKEPYAVLIFGDTGMKQNLSIAFDGRSNFTPDVVNGMPLDVALELQRRYANAGTMAVAKNIEQLDYAMDSDDVRMIIPHHAANWSGGPAKYGVFDLDDFSKVQHERWADDAVIPQEKGKNMSPGDVFGKKLLFAHWLKQEGNEQDAVRAYLQFCEDNHLIPKFAAGKYMSGKTGKSEDFLGYTSHPNYARLLKDYARTDSPQTPLNVHAVNQERLHEYLQKFVESGGWQSRENPNPKTVKRMTSLLKSGKELDLRAREQQVVQLDTKFRLVDTLADLGLESSESATTPTSVAKPRRKAKTAATGGRESSGAQFSPKESETTRDQYAGPFATEAEAKQYIADNTFGGTQKRAVQDKSLPKRRQWVIERSKFEQKAPIRQSLVGAIKSASDSSGRATLADVRDALQGFTREEVDAELRRMERAEEVVMYNEDYAPDRTKRIRAAALDRGAHNERHIVYLLPKGEIQYALKPGQRGIDALREFAQQRKQRQAEVAAEAQRRADLTGIKKDVVNELRTSLGLPALQASRQTVEQWADEAETILAYDPLAADRILNDLAANGRPIDHIDVMVLQFKYRQLQNELKPFQKAYFDAIAAKDDVAIVKTHTDLIAKRAKMTEFEELVRPTVNTNWGRVGVVLRQMFRSNFSREAIFRKAREANQGVEITKENDPNGYAQLEEMAAKLEELDARLDEVSRKADEMEAERASIKQHEEAVSEGKATRSRKKSEKRVAAEKKVADAWLEVRKAMSGSAPAGIPLNLAAPALKLAKAYVDLGVVHFAEFWTNVKNNMPEADEAVFREAWNKAKVDLKVEDPQFTPDDAVAFAQQLTSEARQIQRTLVENGITNRDEIIDIVHEALTEFIPDLTRRMTMDALSRYGQFSLPSQETVDKTIRLMNAEILKLSQIDQLERAIKRADVLRAQGMSEEEIGNSLQEEGMLVAATGMQRDKPTETVRQLTAVYAELKKSIPAPSEKLAGRLQTAQDAVIRGLQNRIRDVKWELENHERIVREKKATPENDAIRALRAELADLMKIHKEKFPPRPMTPEQRLAANEKAAERLLAYMEQQEAAGFPAPPATPAPLTSAELEATRAKIAEIRARRDAAQKEGKRVATLDKQIAELEAKLAPGGNIAPKAPRTAFTSSQIEERIARRRELQAALDARRLEEMPELKEERDRKTYMSNLNRRIADYQRILSEGDFAPKPKKEPRQLSTDELRLKREMEDVRHKVRQKMVEYELAHLKGLAWTGDKIRELSHLSRAIWTSFDISALGRQGGLVAISHPKLAKNALAGTAKSIAETFDSDNALALLKLEKPTMADIKRFLSTIDTRQAEFNFMQRLNEGEWGEFRLRSGLNMTSMDETLAKQEELMQGRWAKYVPGVPLSGRLFSMMLNKMRADLFDVMTQNIGRGGKVTLSEAKLIADFVNVTTGRGGFKWLNDKTATMNVVFFATRWVTSRFQWLAMPAYLPFKGGIKADWRIKREIYKEMSRQVGSIASVLGAVALASALGWDDDDENKPTIELDWKSADFLKIKIGETRYDVTAGLAQAMVFIGRMSPQWMGGGGTKSSVTGKVTPYGEGYPPKTRGSEMLSFLRKKLAPVPGNIATALNGWEDPVGNMTTPLEMGLKMFQPLPFQAFMQSMQTQGIPRGTAETIIASTGIGVSTYGPRTKWLTGTPEQQQEQFKKDLKQMEWDSPDPAYSKFLTPAQMEQVHQRRETVRQNLVYAAAAPEPRPDNYKDEEAYQSEVKQRDKAIDEFRKMNVPVDQAREMLILRYTRVKSDGRKGTLTETYPQRLGSLLKLYGQ